MAHRLPLADYTFIADFAAYARSRADDDYDYTDSVDCAGCQFVRDTGRAANPQFTPYMWRDSGGPWVEISDGIHDALNPAGEPWTFSALADRLEALLVDAPIVLGSPVEGEG